MLLNKDIQVYVTVWHTNPLLLEILDTGHLWIIGLFYEKQRLVCNYYIAMRLLHMQFIGQFLAKYVITQMFES